MTVRDPELLELLREEPELLALADAVEATQRPRRARRFATPVAGTALAVAALVALALVAPWQGERGNPIVERALAAVGGGPVVHVKQRIYSGERIHLATGHVSRVATDWELWYDEERERARLLVRRDGRTVRDGLVVGPDAHEVRTFANVSLAAAARYRTALEHGEARIEREGVVRGRPVYWLRLERSGERLTSEVAVDRRTYEPLRFRVFYDGRPTGYETEALVVQTTARDERDFQAPRLDEPGGHTSASLGGGLVGRPGWAPPVARDALGRTALWVGRSVAGLRLGRIDVEDLSITQHDRGNRRRSGRLLVIRYGERIDPPERALARGIEIREMSSRDAARSLVVDRGGEPPPAGHVDVDTHRISAGPGQCQPKPCDPPGPDTPFEVELWDGHLRRNGLWIEIRATSRQLLLEAARALRPIPPTP